MVKIDWSSVKNILIIILVGICIALAMSTTCTARKNKILEHNIKALNDTVECMTLKNGELVYAKDALILEKAELEQYLDISKKECKELEEKLNSKLAYIAKLEGTIKADSLVMHDTVMVSGDTATIHFSYFDDWLTLEGTTKYHNEEASTIMNCIGWELPLKVGFTDDYRTVVTSSCPYVTFPYVESAIIEGGVANQKPKRWGVGPTFTAGLGWGWGTDFNGNNIGGKGGLIAGFMIGVSIHYDIWQW